MADPDGYVALVASLPRSERLFVAKQPPLSRIRLERRLRVLLPEDAETLRLLEDTLAWPSYRMGTTDTDAFERGKKALACVRQPTLRQLLANRLEIRTVVSAMRRRLAGDPPPSPNWGFGRYRRTIIAHWGERAFGLERIYPWLLEAVSLVEKHKALELERLLLDNAHRLMRRYAARHTFDFEAVAIYVLDWNIFDRWATANAEAAQRRFEDIARHALDDFPEMSAKD